MSHKPDENVTMSHNDTLRTIAPGRYPQFRLYDTGEILVTLRVPPPLKLILFDEENFRGNYRIIRGSIPELQYSFGSRTRSLIVERDYEEDDRIQLYLKPDFKGISHNFTTGSYLLKNIVQECEFISLRIPPDFQIKILSPYKNKTYFYDTPLVRPGNDAEMFISRYRPIYHKKGEKNVTNG